MSLESGDYITHIDHELESYGGLKFRVTNDGKTQECFKLTYKKQRFVLCFHPFAS